MKYLSKVQKEIVELTLAGEKQVDVAKKVGKSQDYVSKTLNHNKLTKAYREQLEREANAVAIEKLTKAKRMLRDNAEEFAKTIIDIAHFADDHSTRLRACEKGLLFSGATLGAQDDMTFKVPKLEIRTKEKKDHPAVEEAQEIVNEQQNE